jgi:uncharacterized protein YggU (UPF0235/DUF167 family)
MTGDAMPFTLREGETALRVRVTPRSAQSRVGGIARDAEGRPALVVRVTAAPEKGKANKAVIATLAKSLRLAKSRLTISAGLAERNKIVAISGDPAEVEAALGNLLNRDVED